MKWEHSKKNTLKKKLRKSDLLQPLPEKKKIVKIFQNDLIRPIWNLHQIDKDFIGKENQRFNLFYDQIKKEGCLTNLIQDTSTVIHMSNNV